MTLGDFFGSFARQGAAPGAPDIATADGFESVAADGARSAAAVAELPQSPPAPAALAAPRAAESVVDESAAARIAELEEQLRTTLERLGRRTTEVRNLEARLKVLDPMVEQVRQRDQWLDEARKESRKILAERDAEAERRRAAEADVAALRKEIDWRDYVIRDLESMPEKLRERDQMLARLRRDHASAIAERDAEITRLRAR